jgi:hypothetical protein
VHPRTSTGPLRNQVELRSRDYIAPRQCVADDHSTKQAPRPVRDVNKMTRVLAALLGVHVADKRRL